MPQPGSSEAVATMNGRQMPNGKATPLAMQNGDNKGQSANGDGNFREMSRTRPPVIEEDLWEMARRKRVHEVLAAADFRTELEQVVRHDFAQSVPEGLSVLQHHQQGSNNNGGVSSFLPRFHQLPALPTLNVNQVLNTPPIPIADLSPSVGAHQYSLEERRSRNRLATLYRLVDLFQWSQGIYNHITLRLPGIDPPHILINPFGLLYHEVTSSSLIKLTLAGDVLDQGSTNLGVNQAAYVLHSAIHEARPDVHCVVHLHTAVVTAVGSMRCGLLPICQEAMIIGPVAYHDYQGILTDEDEKRSIVQDLDDKNVMILRNHGFVACGQSVEDALHLAFHTVIACETQIRAARAGIDNLFVPSKEAALKAYATARKGGGGVNRVQQSGESGKQTSQPSTPAWTIGELEFEAWCRVLDTAGFQTGHVYRNVQLRPSAGLPKSHHSMFNLASSVATPPNGPSSVGAVDESEAAAAWRLSMLRKEQERARWLNSPTHYERVQLLETGTAHPRLVTRWVDQNCVSATSCGTPVKIHSPHQFSPCGGPADGRGEFHDRQRRLKEVRMRGSISAGPKSQLLDGLTRDDVAMGKGSCGDLRGGGHRPLYIGTASRGIIQRDQQINARVYRQLYAPNPFSGQSEEDLKQYLKEVKENSSRPGPKSTGNGTASSAPNSPPTAPKAEPESPNSDTASLMQAVKRVRMKNGGSGVRNGRSASGDGGIPQEQRSRTNGNGVGGGADGKSKCLSTEKEVDPTGEKKQKKRRIFFSFGRKKSG